MIWASILKSLADTIPSLGRLHGLQWKAIHGWQSPIVEPKSLEVPGSSWFHFAPWVVHMHEGMFAKSLVTSLSNCYVCWETGWTKMVLLVSMIQDLANQLKPAVSTNQLTSSEFKNKHWFGAKQIWPAPLSGAGWWSKYNHWRHHTNASEWSSKEATGNSECSDHKHRERFVEGRTDSPWRAKLWKTFFGPRSISFGPGQFSWTLLSFFGNGYPSFGLAQPLLDLRALLLDLLPQTTPLLDRFSKLHLGHNSSDRGG